MSSLFDKDIQELKGVGEKRAKLFRKLGVPTVGALLRFYPRSYEDWSVQTSIGSAALQEVCTVRATVLSPVSETRARQGMLLYRTTVTDGVRDMTVTFFNNPYVKNLLREGKEYLFHGKVTGTLLRREMTVPEFAPAEDGPSVLPIYSQTEGLSSRLIAKAVANAFALLPEVLRDPIPEEIRMQYSLCQLRFALQKIHFPKTMEEVVDARRRLVFEELLVLQLGLLTLKERSRAESQFRIQPCAELFFPFLPFTPTNAQRRAVREAMADMAGRFPMSRLLQGDVGSGKTAVAAALCFAAAHAGLQSALMAPTEILAQQHYRSLSRLLEPAGIEVALLTGSVKGKARAALLSRLEAGEISLVVGTHALLSDTVAFRKLALVITDEQHRFGVAQRAALAGKGNHPHLLVMSATPIPRTLALMIYGDLDISVLDELPPGRQKVATYAISSDKRARAFRYLRKHVDAGRQCYIICPLVEEGAGDMASVQAYRTMLEAQAVFRGCRIGTLHGKMKPKEKDAVMLGFSRGEIDILVSTTVVEVGVDVPNAVIMMIENAERYGLSQLHQLRGRVGRGKYQSTCILVSDAQNEEALARLRIMCKTNDGFRIADEDLRLRGPGDFFGSRQHGLPALQIADLHADMEVLRQAQNVAKALLQKDPKLEQGIHRGLRGQVRLLFGKMGASGLN